MFILWVMQKKGHAGAMAVTLTLSQEQNPGELPELGDKRGAVQTQWPPSSPVLRDKSGAADSVSATHPQAIMRCSLRHTLLCNVNFHHLNQHYCSPWFQDETSLEEKKKPLTFRTSGKAAPYIIQLYIITTECSIWKF